MQSWETKPKKNACEESVAARRGGGGGHPLRASRGARGGRGRGRPGPGWGGGVAEQGAERCAQPGRSRRSPAAIRSRAGPHPLYSARAAAPSVLLCVVAIHKGHQRIPASGRNQEQLRNTNGGRLRRSPAKMDLGPPISRSWAPPACPAGAPSARLATLLPRPTDPGEWMKPNPAAASSQRPRATRSTT